MRSLLLAIVAVAAICMTDLDDAGAYDGPPALPAHWQRGANLTAWDAEALGSSTSDAALQALRATGTTRVALTPTWYQATASSNEIHPDPARTPSDASLEHAIGTARSLAMAVVLKPHIDVEDGAFRGEIAPRSRAEWFRSYRAMLLRYADMAQRSGADILVVGTELTSLTRYSGTWRRLIAQVRTRFGGRLTFAANWIDGATRIRFWNALDLIGVDAYMPLAEAGDDNPTVAQLTHAWRRRGYVRDLRGLARRAHREVVFTELGYRSAPGTAARPWEWPATSSQGDQEPQARAYEAALRAFADQRWFGGVWWWDWSAQGWNAMTDDDSYRFAGKAAEQVVRAWNHAR